MIQRAMLKRSFASKAHRPVRLKAQSKMFPEKEKYRWDFKEGNDWENATQTAFDREFVIPYVNNRHFASEALLMSDRQIRNRVRHLVSERFESNKAKQNSVGQQKNRGASR